MYRIHTAPNLICRRCLSAGGKARPSTLTNPPPPPLKFCSIGGMAAAISSPGTSTNLQLVFKAKSGAPKFARWSFLCHGQLKHPRRSPSDQRSWWSANRMGTGCLGISCSLVEPMCCCMKKCLLVDTLALLCGLEAKLPNPILDIHAQSSSPYRG